MRLSLVVGVLCVGRVAGSPWNPYPAQDLNQESVGVPLSQLVCNMISGVNASNIDKLKQDPKFVGEIAQYTCGNNRGIFVIQKPGYENYTYSCADFPASWCKDPTRCGWNEVLADNEGQQLMDYINLFFEGMFNSSIEKHPADCSFDAYGAITCPKILKEKEPWRTAPWVDYLNGEPIRGVNVGGLFVLEPWINRGFASWGATVRDQLTYSVAAKGDDAKIQALKSHWETWYTQDDFDNMRNVMKLNTIRLPLGWWYFADKAGIDLKGYIVPDASITDPKNPINKVIKMAQTAGLKVIVDLHGAPCSQNGLDNSGNKSLNHDPTAWGGAWLYTKSCMDDHHKVLDVMAEWVVEGLPAQGINDTVIMLELVNEPWVFTDISLVRDFYFNMLNSIRTKKCAGAGCPKSYWNYKTLPLLWHDAFRHFPWTWLLKHMDLTNVFMDTHLYHAFNIADIASDTEACDRQKMTITENIACQYDGLLHYKTCTSIPTFVGEWSLGIDDCMGFLNGAPTTPQARNSWDAGQCRAGDLAARVTDPWWTQHYQSFAKRQIYTFERQLGWAFWTYKVDAEAQKDPSSNWWSMSQAFDKRYISVPYDAFVQDGCSHLAAVPECTESNGNRTGTRHRRRAPRILKSDIRNLRGQFW